MKRPMFSIMVRWSARRQHAMADDFHSADDADANHMVSAQGIAVDKRPQLPGNQCRSRNLAGGDEPSGNGH